MKWKFWEREAPADLSELDRYALELVRLHEPLDVSSEWKRHNVYASLIRQYPTSRRYLLAAAIERAVTRLRES